MSIVKLESPAEIGTGESKGGSGMLIFGLVAAAALYLGFQYFSNKKKREELERLAKERAQFPAE